MQRVAWLMLVLAHGTAMRLSAAEPAKTANKPNDPSASTKPADTSRGDRMIAEYFRTETRRITERCLADIQTAEDWQARRAEYRRQLLEMLGLDPLPERTPLKPVVTGTVEHPEFTVEKLHFQSRPGLYVTGNLYVPKALTGKAPTILYVCGHGQVKKNGISYGNKTHYQHHGAWFARNGYVCLAIDTLQLGEIEGIHHGTYREKMWWWPARGYTSAGVEAWNCIRALDYLESRPEVDAEKIGVTGRSGGGAYSWWIAALDDRIKVAVPVAGITSMHNHVVDGCVEGHCDCMYQVNTYGWDFPLVAALVAPRPLLISNTDKDGIFPLDGVVDVYTKTRRLYELHGALKNIGLQITEGPHADTQELRIHAFVWFNRFLKGDNPPIETAAVKFFEPEQLKVFDQLPDDEKNTTIQETFTVEAEPPAVPETPEDWQQQRDAWLAALREKSFRGWPADGSEAAVSRDVGRTILSVESVEEGAATRAPDRIVRPTGATGLDLKEAFSVERDGIHFSAYDFTSQESIRLRLYLAHRAGLKRDELELVVLNALDDAGWTNFLATMQVAFADELKEESLPAADAKAFEQARRMFESQKWGMAYVAPRGVGPTAWNFGEKKRTQIFRRFVLLGQTLDGMRVWDVRRAAQALRSIDGMKDVPLWMQGEREAAGIALYASLFEPDVKRVDLWQLPKSHRDGPIFLNVLRYLDVPQAVAMLAEKTNVRIYGADTSGWEYPQAFAAKLGWDKKRFQLVDP